MAEEAKEKEGDGEEKKSLPKITAGEIIGFFILLYIIMRIFQAFNSPNTSTSANVNRFRSFSAFFESFGLGGLFESTVSTYIFFISVLSMLFILGIIYLTARLVVLERDWKASFYPSAEPEGLEPPKNERWQRVIAHISSDNPSDWRLAILECDIILDELLDKQGYYGGTIGDKLKNADPAHFKTIDNAWEAHKIRNAIAHEGQDFTLTQREARRIVGLYETVFREFDFV
jgi:hypothetical protein